MRLFRRALGAVLFAVLLLSGCSGDGDSTPPTTPATSDASSTSAPPASPAPSPSPTTIKSQGLTVTPIEIERCTPQGGMIKIQSSGFTPGDKYRTSAIQPDGTPYPDIDPGTATPRGTTSSGWKWPCKGDLPGPYEVTIEDLETGRKIPFTIIVHDS